MPPCIVAWQLPFHIIIILSRPRLRSDADITKQNIFISSEVFQNFCFPFGYFSIFFAITMFLPVSSVLLS